MIMWQLPQSSYDATGLGSSASKKGMYLAVVVPVPEMAYFRNTSICFLM